MLAESPKATKPREGRAIRTMSLDTAKLGRRLQMLAMSRAGATAKDIARHFRYTIRHVRRELAEARRAEGAKGGR